MQEGEHLPLTNVEELRSILLESKTVMIGGGTAFRTTPERMRLHIEGHNLGSHYGAGTDEGELAAQAQDCTNLYLGDLPLVFELDPLNQTVKVSAGIPFPHLTRLLGPTGFTIPHHWQAFDTGDGEFYPRGTQMPYRDSFESLGDALATDLPHAREAQHGSWRDWVIGATIMLADGSIVKSGSSVVKSVTGFDLHKLMIGARHTLGIFLDITLKVIPTASLQPHDFTEDEAFEHKTWTFPYHAKRACAIRVAPEQFNLALTQLGTQVWGSDALSSTIWYEGLPQDSREFAQHCWSTYWDDEPEITNPQTQALMRRTKQLFDPTNKLNPGEFGLL
jgi:FAD/FMN-containing dehydrogenase